MINIDERSCFKYRHEQNHVPGCFKYQSYGKGTMGYSKVVSTDSLQKQILIRKST